MSTIHGGFDCLPRGEAERLRRDLDDARAALATVTLDRDVWRAQCEQAMRERDEARVDLDCVTHDRNLTERERDEARAEVATACAAMGHGSDDARWKPGETAVDALIRERDEARADADYHRSRAESWQATAQTHMEQRDEARAEAGALRNRTDSLIHAIRCLLLSRDAAWTGGHDWQKAVDRAIRVLGIDSTEEP